MSGGRWPWNILDIAPTDDRKTIREAYARKLKALDPDAAAEFFMDLREARDAALSGDFRDEAGPDDNLAGDLDNLLADALPADATLVDATLAGEPVQRPKFTVEYDDSDDARFDRMAELFTGEGELGDAEAAELEEQLDAVFADDRMADLGHFARIEIWLAELLAQRYPRAARLFPRIAERFEWNERAHELGIHPAISWLVGAHEGQMLVEAVCQADHPYHREWKELAHGRAKGPLFWRRIDHGRMGNLITTVRRDFPWLEQDHWQPALVERWDKKVEGGGIRGPNPWVWFGLLCIFFGALPQCSTLDNPSRQGANPAAAAALETANADKAVAAFIGDRFPDAAADGRTAASLQSKSPKIYSTLHRVGREFKDMAEPRDRIMMKEITETYYLIIDKLPYKLQVADAKFRAATVKKLRDNPRGCAEFIGNPRTYLRQGNSVGVASPEYQYQMFSVVHDEYGDREWVLVPKTAQISGELIGKLIKRSGLSEARVRAAIGSETAPDADLCVAMGSFYELLTEIPAKDASKILPALL